MMSASTGRGLTFEGAASNTAQARVGVDGFAAPAWLESGPVPALDGMRAVSVFIVMAAHSGLQSVVPGGFGVTMFFFISGFLITTLLLREWRAGGGVRTGGFYARRALRLYPPLLVYLGAVVASRVIYAKDVDLVGLAGALFYGGNYLVALAPERIQHFGSHLWSLAVEEHFYLLYPLILPALARAPHRGAILAISCGVALAMRCAYATAGVSEDYIIIASETRFDSILFGAMLAFMAASPRGRPRLAAATQPLALAGAVAALLLSFLIRDPFFRETARYSLQGLALFAIFGALVFAAPDALARRLLDTRAMRWAGALSYSLYLWHSAMYALAHAWLDGRAPAALVVALGWIGAFVVAAAVYHLIERPMFALRRRVGSDVKTLG